MEGFNPEYVLILSGDHIYKMDYEVMLDFHKQNGSECTIAVMPVPMEEAKRFGIMITDENKRIVDFEEKPANPRSNLASMGIYIFNWKTLKQALIDNADQPNLDFGKHVIPYCHKTAHRCTHMNLTVTGKMSEPDLLLGSEYGADRCCSGV